MTRISKSEAIAGHQKLIREMRAASPVDTAELSRAVMHLKWLRSIGKKPSDKRARLIGAVRGTLETLLKPCTKPSMNPEIWGMVAESVVRICDQQSKALKARHKKPGASHDKGEAMRNAWATRRWRTKDECAEKFGPTIKLKFDAARRHLRGA
jgi:hypothetical protein